MGTDTPARRTFLINLAALSWIGVILQLVLILQNRVDPVPATLVRFISFFTILNNLLVAICSSFVLLRPLSRWGLFFSKGSTLTAVTLYIMVVGIVYNVILRFQWQPQGLQRVVDELLHSVVPALFSLFWIFFVDKRPLRWKQIPAWLIYPFLYCGYIMARGALVHDYPYPFMNVDTYGYQQVLINSFFVLLLFLVLSVLLVGGAKLVTGKIDPVL